MKKLVLIWVVTFLAIPFFSYTQNIEEYIELKKQLQEELLGTYENITAEEEAVYSLKSRGVNDFGAAPAPVWANHFGGTPSDMANAVVSDNSGNIYVTGTFSGKITVNATDYNSVGLNDAFVSKLNSIGEVVWFTHIPATAGNKVYSNDIVIDASGNSYITGHYTGSITLNTTELPDINNFTFFYAKLDGSGNIVNGAYHAEDENEMGLFVDTDAAGNVYATVSKTNINGSRHESWILKYDQSANLVWAKSFDESFNSIIVYGENLFFSGVMNNYNDGYIDENLTLPPVSYNDIFIAKSDLDGNFIWGYVAGHSTGGVDSYEGYLDTDYNGSFYLMGSFRGSVAFGEYSVEHSLSLAYGRFVLKFNQNCEFQWLNLIENKNLYDIVADVSGNVFINYYDSVNRSYGIIKFDTNGTEQWTNIQNKHSRDLFITVDGKIVTIGSNNELIYISQLSSSAAEEWLVHFDGNSGTGRTAGLAADNAGNVYTYGTTA
ncbi:MAG TPA: hypothetical protein P5132_03980, partial [Bacteroidales bacterium]|nr:hypothetical protein [Bacteroidales bacterium]